MGPHESQAVLETHPKPSESMSKSVPEIQDGVAEEVERVNEPPVALPATPQMKMSSQPSIELLPADTSAPVAPLSPEPEPVAPRRSVRERRQPRRLSLCLKGKTYE